MSLQIPKTTKKDAILTNLMKKLDHEEELKEIIHSKIRCIFSIIQQPKSTKFIAAMIVVIILNKNSKIAKSNCNALKTW